jgi:hypothetical protein
MIIRQLPGKKSDEIREDNESFKREIHENDES